LQGNLEQVQREPDVGRDGHGLLGVRPCVLVRLHHLHAGTGPVGGQPHLGRFHQVGGHRLDQGVLRREEAGEIVGQPLFAVFGGGLVVDQRELIQD
jgi:hypothetical protein